MGTPFIRPGAARTSGPFLRIAPVRALRRPARGAIAGGRAIPEQIDRSVRKPRSMRKPRPGGGPSHARILTAAPRLRDGAAPAAANAARGAWDAGERIPGPEIALKAKLAAPSVRRDHGDGPDAAGQIGVKTEAAE